MVSRDELSQMLNDEEREAISTLVNTTRDGVIYVSLDDVAKALGRELYYDNTTVNFGMALLANGEFTLPNDTNTLQKLNDFVFYFRPSKEKFKADYDNSALAGVHPRLVATESDFERLRCEIRDNPHKAR
jgi:hypothetical protein